MLTEFRESYLSTTDGDPYKCLDEIFDRPQGQEATFFGTTKYMLQQLTKESKEDHFPEKIKQAKLLNQLAQPHISSLSRAILKLKLNKLQKRISKNQSALDGGALCCIKQAVARGVKIDIEKEEVLGRFGKQFIGRLEETPVIIQTIEKKADLALKKKKPSKVDVYINLSYHPNLVCCYGVQKKQDAHWVIIEHCNAGTLTEFLLKMDANLSAEQRYKLMRDVAAGMKHLKKHKAKAGELAKSTIHIVENVLQQKDSPYRYTAKISPFQSREAKTQWMWKAPEVLLNEKAINASDVWSFGMICLEIMQGGKEPYVNTNSKEKPDHHADPEKVITLIKNKGFIPTVVSDYWKEGKTAIVQEKVIAFLNHCFAYDPDKRPSFKQIVTFLESKIRAPYDPEAKLIKV